MQNTFSIVLFLNALTSVLVERSQPKLAAYTEIAATLLASGQATNDDLQLLGAKLDEFTRENRDPSFDELMDLKKKRESLTDAIKEHIRIQKAATESLEPLQINSVFMDRALEDAASDDVSQQGQPVEEGAGDEVSGD